MLWSPQTILLYDEALPDQRTRATALYDIIGYLQRCRAFGPEPRNSLSSAITSACLRLLSRTEQCRALCAAACLWWQPLKQTQLAAPPTIGDRGVASGGAEDGGREGATATVEQDEMAKEQPGVYPPVRDGEKVSRARAQIVVIIRI